MGFASIQKDKEFRLDPTGTNASLLKRLLKALLDSIPKRISPLGNANQKFPAKVHRNPKTLDVYKTRVEKMDELEPT